VSHAFLLAASCDGRSSAYSFKYGPSLVRGTNTGKVEVQDNFYSASIHCNQQYNILELEEKHQLP